MAGIQIIIIAALGIGVAFLIFFIAKSIAAPKRIDEIQKLLDQGKYSSAIKKTKNILSKDPDDYKAHYFLGKAYMAENKSELALMEYKIVNQTAIFDAELPEVEFRQQIAALYMKFNQPKEALKQYLLLTKLDPGNAENYYNVGQLYDQANRADISLGFYQKAIKLNKRHVKAYAAMGLQLYRSKQYKEAKKAIDYAISLSPQTYSTYYYQGKILKDNKDYPGAIKSFEKSLRDPDYRQRSLIERGLCYMAGKSYDNAVADLLRAVSSDKNGTKSETLYARYFLADCYEKTRKIEKAIDQWKQIYTKNHTFRDVAAKLTEYRDLESNDSLKEYLTCSDEEFEGICKRVTVTGFGLSPQQTDIKKDLVEIIATEKKNDDWMSMRKQTFLLRFYRDSEPIPDTEVRNVVERVKAKNCTKGTICTSTGFTRSAVGYAENRPVELIGKEKLEKFLDGAGI
ncbi:MAG: tetratricopeptide repeat protein [Treponema sp.]|jgi:tetratricopeptide (TPR) repeat protein|nr:tetratricopeptide repeat protein [Treponema sp.]